MSQLVTQAAITFQPTDLRIHEQAGEQWLVAPLAVMRAMQRNGERIWSSFPSTVAVARPWAATPRRAAHGRSDRTSRMGTG